MSAANTPGIGDRETWPRDAAKAWDSSFEADSEDTDGAVRLGAGRAGLGRVVVISALPLRPTAPALQIDTGASTTVAFATARELRDLARLCESMADDMEAAG